MGQISNRQSKLFWNFRLEWSEPNIKVANHQNLNHCQTPHLTCQNPLVPGVVALWFVAPQPWRSKVPTGFWFHPLVPDQRRSSAVWDLYHQLETVLPSAKKSLQVKMDHLPKRRGGKHIHKSFKIGLFHNIAEYIIIHQRGITDLSFLDINQALRCECLRIWKVLNTLQVGSTC